MKLVFSLLIVAAISCCGAQLKTNEELNDQFKKMKRVLNKGNKKMKKIEAKILANNANGVEFHPTSCQEVGKYRKVLPQPEEIHAVGKKVKGTHPGMYRIYKADYDNVGRMAYCYSVPESGLPERADLVPLHLTLPGPEPYVEPHAMFEPTNCQTVRYAVRSFGANVNRNFWLKIGENSERVRCEGEEVVIMQRGYGSDEVPNRKIDFKQHFEWYMKGFGKMKENADFFMGLDPLSTMTSQGKWQLTVTLEKRYDDVTLTAKYSGFRVSQYPDYTLDYDSYLERQSNMSDALKKSKGYPFSSWDRERSGGSCTSDTTWGDPVEDGNYPSSWWYGKDREENSYARSKINLCGFDESPFMYGFITDDRWNQQLWGNQNSINSIKMTMRRTDVQNLRDELNST